MTSAYILDSASCLLIQYFAALLTDLRLYPDATSAFGVPQWLAVSDLGPIWALYLTFDLVPHCLAVDYLWLVFWLPSCLLIRCYHVPAYGSYLVVQSSISHV